MSDESRMKERRLRDFQARVAAEPNGALPLGAGGEIVTVHPLADEHDLLAKLGIRAEECTSVDGYWAIDDDVVFLQVEAANREGDRGRGLYARLASYPPRHVNLVVVADAPQITRAVLEDAARELRRVGWDRGNLGDKLVPLQSSG